MARYQRHKSKDQKLHNLRMRREKAITLLPLLSVLCFAIGIILVIVALLAFRNSQQFKWLVFSGAYLVIGVLLLLISCVVKLINPVNHKYDKKKYR